MQGYVTLEQPLANDQLMLEYDSLKLIQILRCNVHVDQAEAGILPVIVSLLDIIPSCSFIVSYISPGSNSLPNHWHTNPYLKVLF